MGTTRAPHGAARPSPACTCLRQYRRYRCAAGTGEPNPPPACPAPPRLLRRRSSRCRVVCLSRVRGEGFLRRGSQADASTAWQLQADRGMCNLNAPVCYCHACVRLLLPSARLRFACRAPPGKNCAGMEKSIYLKHLA
jgi:hypothetical protein